MTNQQCIHRAGCPKPDVCRQVGHCTSMTATDLELQVVTPGATLGSEDSSARESSRPRGLLTNEHSPCPFCGDRDIRTHWRGHPLGGEWVIECHSCPCELTGFASEQAAWTRWNQRSSPVEPTREPPYRVRAFWSPDRVHLITACCSADDISVLDDNANIWEPTGPEQDMAKPEALTEKSTLNVEDDSRLRSAIERETKGLLKSVRHDKYCELMQPHGHEPRASIRKSGETMNVTLNIEFYPQRMQMGHCWHRDPKPSNPTAAAQMGSNVVCCFCDKREFHANTWYNEPPGHGQYRPVW